MTISAHIRQSLCPYKACSLCPYKAKFPSQTRHFHISSELLTVISVIQFKPNLERANEDHTLHHDQAYPDHTDVGCVLVYEIVQLKATSVRVMYIGCAIRHLGARELDKGGQVETNIGGRELHSRPEGGPISGIRTSIISGLVRKGTLSL